MAAAFAGRLQWEEVQLALVIITKEGSISKSILTGHQVLQIQLLLLFAFATQTDGGAAQQNRRNQTGRNAGPGHNVRPVVRDARVVTQNLFEMKRNTRFIILRVSCANLPPSSHRIPLLEELLAHHFLLLEELHRMPQAHRTGRQQARNQHQNRRRRNRTGRSLPAAGQTRPERTEDGQKAEHEQGHTAARQMQPCHRIIVGQLLSVELRIGTDGRRIGRTGRIAVAGRR